MNRQASRGATAPDTLCYVARNRPFLLLLGRRLLLRRPFICLGAWLAILAGACSIDRALRIDDGVGLVEDGVMYVLLPCLLGVIATTRHVLSSLEHLLSQLPSLTKGRRRGNAERTGARYARVVRDFVALRSPAGARAHRRVLLLMVALVAVFQVAIPLAMPGSAKSWAIWPQRYPVAYLAATAWAAFYWCLIVGNALWYVLSSSMMVRRVLRRYAYRELLFIVPVAPDGKGGLLPLAQYSMSLTWVAACGLLFPLSWMLQFGATFSLALGLGAYLCALAMLLFAPMWAVHDAMRAARDRELDRLAELFRIGHAQLPDPQRSQHMDDSQMLSTAEATLTYLAHIDQLHRRAEAMPVWPFDVSTLGQFGALVIVPFALFIAQTFSEEWIRAHLSRLLP